MLAINGEAIFGLCCALFGSAICFSPPLLLCWTTSVLIKRYLHERPIGWRMALEACMTGFQLVLVWMIPSAVLALVIGIPTALTVALWLEDLGGSDLQGRIAVIGAPLIAIGIFSVRVFVPVVREDWRRLVSADHVTELRNINPLSGTLAPRSSADDLEMP